MRIAQTETRITNIVFVLGFAALLVLAFIGQVYSASTITSARLGVGTSTPGLSFSGYSEGLFGSTVTALRFHATSSVASVFPVASTTSFSVADRITVAGAGASTIPVASTTSFSVANVFTVAGAGTSTVTGGLTVAGLDSSRGLRVSTGDTVLAGGLNVTGGAMIPVASSTSLSVADLITVAGAGTSTVSGGLTVSGSAGTFGIATSAPASEFGIRGDAFHSSGATTTISVESGSATQGGCLELKGVDNSGGTQWVRIYVGGQGTTTSGYNIWGGGQTGITPLLVVDRGRCQ